jgi:hypothetical protein
MPDYRYSKRPVMVEAFCFDDSSKADMIGWPAWLKNAWRDGALICSMEPGAPSFIVTLEGRMEVSMGDFIIKGVEGELYPCKPGIFKKTYVKYPGDRI